MGCGCAGKKKAAADKRLMSQPKPEPKQAPNAALKGPAAPGYFWQGQPEQEG